MSKFPALALALLLTAVPPGASAEVELAPFVGFRAGGEFDVRDSGGAGQSRLEFDDTQSLGLVLNIDLDEPGKQAELYYGRQATTAFGSEALLSSGATAVDVVIHQLQFGGLYFPGGQPRGGFVSGVIGVTRLDPKPGELRSHHRAAIALGAGYKLAINDHLGIRFDLRGIYTALDSGGGVFCSGGCAVRVESTGFLQVEAGAGLQLRF